MNEAAESFNETNGLTEAHSRLMTAGRDMVQRGTDRLAEVRGQVLFHAHELADEGLGRLANVSSEVLASGLDLALSRFITRDGLEVTYPSGETRIYGDAEPDVGITLHTNRVIGRLAVKPTLAIGEGYIFGDVDFTDLADPEAPNAEATAIKSFMRVVYANRVDSPAFVATKNFMNWFRNEPNDPASHYDIGNDFYRLWLDSTLTYSCGYWGEHPEAMTLEEAQERKVNHVLKKLELEEGQRILDIGSGWGNLLITAAEQYGVRGVGITLSEEQLVGARQAAEDRGVGHLVQFILMGYRELAEGARHWDDDERFDRVVSVGMYEHIGRDNQDQYFEAVNRLLKPGGITLMHSITQQQHNRLNPLMDKYVFPAGNLQTHPMIVEAAIAAGLRDPQTESLRPHYALTTDAWGERHEENLSAVTALFNAGKIKHRLIDEPEPFNRLWRLYLATSSAGFRYGSLDVEQFVFTKGINNQKKLTREHIYVEPPEPHPSPVKSQDLVPYEDRPK